jgi:chromosome segregation ATPase
MNCQGLVKDSDAWRQCKNKGSIVLSNGFCHNHQFLAVKKLQEELSQAEEVLNNMIKDGKDKNNDKIIKARNNVLKIQNQLKESKTLCEMDPECRSCMQQLIVDLKQIDNNQLNETSAEIMKHGYAGYPGSYKSFQNSIDWELNRQNKKSADQEIDVLESQLTNAYGHSKIQDLQFKQEIDKIETELNNNRKFQIQSQNIINSLKEQLSRCQNQSTQVSGVYSQEIESLRNENNKLKEKYDIMVGRELSINKSIQLLEEEKSKLKAAVDDLKQSYEDKMKRLQDSFAEKAAGGSRSVLTVREEELQKQVEELTKDLEDAQESLKQAIELGKEASLINDGKNDNKPFTQLAFEYQDLSAQLSNKNKEYNELQEKFEKFRMNYANCQQKVATEVSRSSVENLKEINRLSVELDDVNNKLRLKEQEIFNLKNSLDMIRRNQNNEIIQIKNKLAHAQNKLDTTQREREAEIQQLKNKFQLLEQQEKSKKSELYLEFQHMKESLQSEYAEKLRNMKNEYTTQLMNLNAEKQKYQHLQNQIQEQSKNLRYQTETLERYKIAYEEKLAEFYKQRDSLSNALINAKEQAEQLQSIEKDYQKRITILKQTNIVNKERSEAAIRDLTEKLKDAIEKKNQAMVQLEKCNANRETFIQKLKYITDENNQLKDDYLRIKSQVDIMRAQYETTMEKLRTESAKQRSLLEKCSSNLHDASMVHDHVQRMKKEMENIRNNMQEKERQLAESQEAIKQSLNDKDMDKQQIFKLQYSLKESDTEQKMLKENLEQIKQDNFNLRKMYQDITNELKRVSEEYRRAMLERESLMEQEKRTQAAKEREMLRKLKEVQISEERALKELASLRKQKNLVNQTLVNSEVNHAIDMARLLDSEHPDVLSRQF